MAYPPDFMDCGSYVYIDGIPSFAQLDTLSNGKMMVVIVYSDKHQYHALTKCNAYCKRHDLPAHNILIVNAAPSGLDFSDFIACHVQKLANELDIYATHRPDQQVWH